MRQLAFSVLAAVLLFCGGCHRAHSVSDFPLSATLTQEELESKVGSPTRISASTYWWTYTLKDQTELRLYFLGGPQGTNRTLTNAAIYTQSGNLLKTVFSVPVPVTKQGTATKIVETTQSPASAPATAPVESTVPASQPAAANH